jgi:hypothetical protein
MERNTQVPEVRKPVLMVFRPSSGDGTPILHYNYQSGPEKTKHTLTVSADEYRGIVQSILQDQDLIQQIVQYWLTYAEKLKQDGIKATAPPRNHHVRFLGFCDAKDASRAALISMLLSERIESEVLAITIEREQPDWVSEFEIRYHEGEKDFG